MKLDDQPELALKKAPETADARKGSRGSVTYLQAETMAVNAVGESSATAIAKVLDDNQLGLR